MLLKHVFWRRKITLDWKFPIKMYEVIFLHIKKVFLLFNFQDFCVNQVLRHRVISLQNFIKKLWNVALSCLNESGSECGILPQKCKIPHPITPLKLPHSKMVDFSFIWPNFFLVKVNKSNGKDLSINRNDDDDDDHDD